MSHVQGVDLKIDEIQHLSAKKAVSGQQNTTMHIYTG